MSDTLETRLRRGQIRRGSSFDLLLVRPSEHRGEWVVRISSAEGWRGGETRLAAALRELPILA